MDRQCYGCKQTKPAESFAWKDKRRGVRSSQCLKCRREYSRAHYRGNVDAYLTRNAKARVRLRMRDRRYLDAYLDTHPCVDCGLKEHVCLQFDHRDDAVKCGNLADMVGKGFALAKIKAEIAKCVVRCANCHQRRTAKQQRWHRDVEPAPLRRRSPYTSKPTKAAA